MSEGAAYIVRQILENGGRPDAPFVETRQRVAWKTGTSFGFRDAWAVGVTDRYTVGIWVGRPDGTPNPGHFGANTSAPLLRDLLAALGQTQGATRAVPAGVRATEICWPLGLAVADTAPAQCRVRRSAWTLDGSTPPTLPDRVHDGGLLETVWIDSRRGQRLTPACLALAATPIGDLRAVATARWPTLLDPWIDAAQRGEAERLPLAAGCASASPQRSLRISGLDPGSVIRARPGSRAAVLSVQAVGTREAVTWLLDGRLVGQTEGREGRTSALPLKLTEAGPHALTAMDALGRYEQVRFSVKEAAEIALAR
jgi:penicillin-binding protein 1C